MEIKQPWLFKQKKSILYAKKFGNQLPCFHCLYLFIDLAALLHKVSQVSSSAPAPSPASVLFLLCTSSYCAPTQFLPCSCFCPALALPCSSPAPAPILLFPAIAQPPSRFDSLHHHQHRFFQYRKSCLLVYHVFVHRPYYIVETMVLSYWMMPPL